ncbi:hypothetical protein [Nocardioides sp. SLBN-35]|uniref:hypothetical protein n=1 Tax=Nocardioides sp. SLBN-35 TaxID=2768445 RepID=UPI00114D58DD|nr:hypothetical protein [Nocardioides sp. SLBN-35]TQK70118.1 hypothetical protein FBY23_1890 [Nocardioides sp. SLBN-35]
MSRRPRVVAVAVATTVVVAALGGLAWVRASSSDEAAAAARRYVDLVASGDEDELAGLAAMTAEDTAALDDAAGLLAAADERIDVVSIGDPVESDDVVEVEVRYRLAGEEHTWPLRLGRVGDDWRISSPMVGSVAWDEPGVRNVDTDIRLGGNVLERRPRVQDGDGSGESVQPLYPAVYGAEKRIDPYFTSTPALVAVLPGAPTAEPSLPLVATDATRQALAADFTASADACGGPEAFARCPFFDLVQTARAGGDPSAPGWWRGLVGTPTVAVDSVPDGITVTGAFRYAARGGVRTMRFTATGQIGFEAVRRTPTLAGLEVAQAD